MKSPPHPGGLVLWQCIEPLSLTIPDAAAALGLTRTRLSELVKEKHGISLENGRAIVQGVPRQRRKLAFTASAVRSCAGPRRGIKLKRLALV